MHYPQSIYHTNKHNKKNYISNFLPNKIYKPTKPEFVRKNNLFLSLNCYCVNNFKMLQIEKTYIETSEKKKKKIKLFCKGGKCEYV